MTRTTHSPGNGALPRHLPILCYHRVVSEEQAGGHSNIHVTPGQLDRQLRQLRHRRMTPVTFADLAGDRPLPERPVILTFDDGYRDNYEHLLPLLEAHDACAVIFALGDRSLRTNAWDRGTWMAQAPLMNDAQLRACAESGRIEIGSHGLAHRHLRELDDNALEQELRESKRSLEIITGQAVTSFAYPWGEWDERVSACVARTGYLVAVATDHGTTLEDNPYAAARRIIFPTTSRFGFYKKTSGWYRRYRHLMGRPA